MAAKNKCLAQINKSSTGGKATKKYELRSPRHRDPPHETETRGKGAHPKARLSITENQAHQVLSTRRRRP